MDLKQRLKIDQIFKWYITNFKIDQPRWVSVRSIQMDVKIEILQ